MNVIDIATAASMLQSIDDILILTHKRPDGDTTGCAGALCLGLRQMGKEAYVLENTEVTARYASLITPYYPPQDFTPWHIVAVDTAEEKLFTDNAAQYQGKVDLVIDHHPSNTKYGKNNLINANAGSCAEIVFEVLQALGVRLTADIATCLYISTATDTGCFKYSNTTAHSHAVAAACLAAGIPGAEINRTLFEMKSRARLQVERLVCDTMEFAQEGAIAIVTLLRKDLDRIGATKDDLDSISSIARQIEGVDIGITLTEDTNGTVKISVRTTKSNAAAICAPLGGGGHLRAAGAAMRCSIEKAKATVLQVALDEVSHAG